MATRSKRSISSKRAATKRPARVRRIVRDELAQDQPADKETARETGKPVTPRARKHA